MMVSGFSVQGLATRLPDTWNLYKLSACLLPRRGHFFRASSRKKLRPL